MGFSGVERDILRSVDEEDAVRLVRDLIRIPSPNPPGDTREVAKFLAETAEGIGLDATIFLVEDVHASVVARLEGAGGGKSLLLNGHIDTVPIGDRGKWTVDPLAAVMRDGKIFGRGSTDCKGGVAAMLIAADALIRAGVRPRGDVILAMVAGEETLSLKGTGYLLDREAINADAAIVVEPTALPDGAIQTFTASRGMIWLEVEVEGVAAHAKVAHLGVNAIEKMAKIVLALQSLRFPRSSGHPLCGMPTVNVGTIEGGTSPSVVPDKCLMRLDRDTVPGEDSAGAIEQILETIEGLKREDESLRASVRVILAEDPVEISQEEPIVKLLKENLEAVQGAEAGFGGMIGANDSRLLIRRGIPAAICGPGIATQSHSADEYVEIRAVLNAAKAYALTMARFCG
jgi:acetylornithine deacetylase/succinyl-diaminopimelate desuccinylase family protein